MVIRIPAADEPAAFGPPLQAADSRPPDGLSEPAREAVRRAEARDNALFVSAALAELAARRHRAARAAEAAAFGGDDGLERAADGFATRLDNGFESDVTAIAADAAAASGPRPSDDALDLFRRRAQGLRQSFLARASVIEDTLRKQGQEERGARAIAALTDLVRDDPDALDEARLRLDELAAAAAPLLGEPAADALRQRARGDLAAAAAGGLIARDPAQALAAIRDGEVGADLEEDARAGLERAARLRAAAVARDEARNDAAREAAGSRERAARAVSFLAGFERRLDDGTATLAEVADAEAAGTVSAARAERLRGRLAERDVAEADLQTHIARIGRMLDDGTPPDAGDPGFRAAAERWFERIVRPMLADGEAPDVAQAIPPIAALLGFLPDGAAALMRGALIAGSPQGQVAAARAFERIDRRDRGAFRRLPPGEQGKALRLYELDALGVPADEAVRLADAMPPGGLRADAVPLSGQADQDRPETTQNPDASSGAPHAASIRKSADGVARANLGVDDDAGPDDGSLTSGAIRRGADDIARSADRAAGPPEKSVSDGDPDAADASGGSDISGAAIATEEERRRQKDRLTGMKTEEKLKRRQADEKSKAGGRTRRSGGRPFGGGGGGGGIFEGPWDRLRPPWMRSFDFRQGP